LARNQFEFRKLAIIFSQMLFSLPIFLTFLLQSKKYSRLPWNMQCSPYLPVEMLLVGWWGAASKVKWITIIYSVLNNTA
jgi:hypothetical protein